MTLTSLQSSQNGLDRRTNSALEPDPFLPPGSEMDACQAHFPIDQGKVFGLIENITIEQWNGFMKGFPKYVTNTCTWEDHRAKIWNYISSQGIYPENTRNAALLRVTTYNHLDSTAAARAVMLLPENCSGVDYPEYLRRLGALFDPPLRSYELMETYYARRQKRIGFQG